MAVLTSLRIPLNFEGVTSEIGKYPLAKILIADAYMHGWVINSLLVQYICLALFTNITVHLWNNDVHIMNGCPANILLCKDVVYIVAQC